MKTFREFIETKRKYISIIYDNDTQEKLRNWCKENNFDLTTSYDGNPQEVEDFEFHTTIFYSENKVQLKNGKTQLNNGEAFPIKFELLGTNKDIPVLVINSPDIIDIRKRYEEIGLTDEWPNYIPHISLSYVKKDYDLNKLKLPDFKIKFETLKVKDIEENI